MATVGTLFQGLIHITGDTIDFYSCSGLTAGDSFDLPANIFPNPDASTIRVAVYTDQTTFGDFVDLIAPGNMTDHQTGVVPGSGALTFGVTMTTQLTSTTFLAAYNIELAVSTAAEPASAALLAAGLGGLALVRWRKRR